MQSILAVATVILLTAMLSVAESETWRGLVIAPESRCSPYSSDDYSHSQSVEDSIIARTRAIYGPYTGRYFANKRMTDIEHIVAKSEAHDSGLCGASARLKAAFASDPLNLTLASPRVNRQLKKAKDAAEWLPDHNRCWFAARIVLVRRKYNLTIDRNEARELERILSGCSSTELIVYRRTAANFVAAPDKVRASTAVAKGSAPLNPLELWDDNGNGRITCKEARRHGIAPVPRKHPAYAFMRDGDGDGVVCE